MPKYDIELRPSYEKILIRNARIKHCSIYEELRHALAAGTWCLQKGGDLENMPTKLIREIVFP